MNKFSVVCTIAALVPSVLSGVLRIPTLVPRAPDEPFQHRLAYAGTTGMTVSWNTRSQVAQPTIQYGKDPNDLSESATGDSSTYPTSTSFNNHVKITDLKPDTVYFYRVATNNSSVGGGSDSADTPVFNFRTARASDDHSEFSIAVVVDMGLMGKMGLSDTVGIGAANPLAPNETNTIQSLMDFNDTYVALLHPGDISYADYWLKESIQQYIPGYTPNNMTFLTTVGVQLYETMLEQFYDQIQPLTATKPYMVGAGNHESNCDNGGTKDKPNKAKYNDTFCVEGQNNFTGYINHFRMPSTESGGQSNMWYSWNYGLVHFVQIDTETDLGNGLIGPTEPGGSEGFHGSGPFGAPNEQINWLENDLASVDRNATPWVVVFGHRPYYATGHGEDVVRQAFEQTFLTHNVDLVMTGHVHLYERMTAIANSQPDPNELENPSSPWYILNGSGGHYDGLDSRTLPPANYSRFTIDDAYGWSRLTFHNATHLTHEFVASRNGSVLDTATLFKARDNNNNDGNNNDGKKKKKKKHHHHHGGDN